MMQHDQGKTSSPLARTASQSFAVRLLGFALLVLLPLLLLTAYNIRRDIARERDDAVDQVRLLSGAVAEDARHVLGRVERLLDFLSQRPELLGMDGPRCTDLLKGQVQVDPMLANIGVIDARGQGICSSIDILAGTNLNFAQDENFRLAMARQGTVLGRPMQGRVARTLILPVMRVLRNESGQALGVIAVSIDLVGLSQSWQRFGLPEGSVMVLHDERGTIVARYPDSQRWIGHDASAKVASFLAANPTGVGADVGLDEVPRVLSMQEMKERRGWQALAGLPVAHVFAEAEARKHDALLAVAGALGLALVLALWLSRSLAAPLIDLARAAAAVASGERRQRARESAPGEFRTVAHEFNRMIDSLSAAETQVRRLNGFYQALSLTNRALVRGGDNRQQLCAEVCAACVDAGHALLATLWLREGDKLRMHASAGPVLSMYGATDVVLDFGDQALATTPTGEALRSGQPTVANDYQHDPRTTAWHHRARQDGVRAMAAVPLVRRGAVEAMLLLHVAETDWFDAPLLKLLTEMVDDLAFGFDIIEREAARAEAERQVVHSRERFQRLFQAAPLPVAVFDYPGDRLLDANQAFVEGLGFTLERMRGHTLNELGFGLAGADAARLHQRLREQRGRLRGFEVPFRLRDGRIHEVQINAEQIEFDGQPALLTISADMTQRKRTEEALRESLARFELAASTGHVWAWRPDTGLKPPETLLDMLGYSDEQLGHQPGLWLPEVHAQDRGALVDAVRRHLSERTPLELEFRIRGRDGREYWLHARGQAQWADDGTVLQMAGIVFDVSSARDAEQARAAQQAAEAASRAKTQMVSRVAHELRNPLNAVLGFLQLLESDTREPLSESQRRHVEQSRRAGRHLTQLIDDLLDVSRIEAGELRMQLGAVRLSEVLDGALSVGGELARKHGVQLGPAPACGHLHVQADAARLHQVLINLLSNAAKYNRPGGAVRLDLRQGTEPGWVHVEVVDTGLGMSAEQLAHLYEPFNRLGREHSSIEGTGIGLALTRQLVEAMGGQLRVDSEPGRGSCVRVSLRETAAPAVDAEPAPAPAAELGDQAPLQGLLLYVEDDPVNQLLVQQFLTRWPGVHLHLADSGAEGLKQALALRPDLILLDMHLSDMDGLALMQALQAAGGAPAVVALSANAGPDDIEAARAAGIRDYWTKPLDMRAFGAGLRAYLRAAD